MSGASITGVGRLIGTLGASGNLNGSLNAGSMILNDYTLTVTEIPGGSRLTITRGSEVQTMDFIGSVDEAQVEQIVRDYLQENPPSGGVSFTTDETLTLDPETGVLGVNTADEAETDNTLPITSAAVATQLGNIEILLKTI